MAEQRSKMAAGDGVEDTTETCETGWVHRIKITKEQDRV